MELERAARFHWADYVVFGASLTLSAGVGVYFGVTGKRQGSTEEFLMAGRSMNPIPVSISLFVSWMSAISFLADPIEAYNFGITYWIVGIGYSLGLPLVAHYFAPYFHRMKVVSAYEFLETKYNKGFRVFATATNIMVILLWLGIVLYAPALALSQSSGMPVWVALVSIGVVCTFYTALGGMKAVLWTDTLQMVIMVAGQLAIVIQGVIKVGGISKLMEILSETGHTRTTTFDPSPFRRASFWTFLVGGFFRTFIPYCSAQMQIQRYCTVKTPNMAALAVYLNIPIYLLMITLFAAIGMIMAALYADCDPLLQGRVTRQDQMVPLLVLEVLGFLPGIPGLFMACVFSASLSSLSSGINSMSANTLKDFIEPAYNACNKKNMSDQLATVIAKLLVVGYGVIILGMSFAMMATGGSIFALCAKAVGMVGSPLGGAFVIGILFPSITSRSVLPAFTISLAICLWWGIGAFFMPYRPPPEALPVSLDHCDILNSSLAVFNQTTTSITQTTTVFPHLSTIAGSSLVAESSTYSDIYYLNPMLYGPFGCLSTILLALTFHAITVCIRKTSKIDRYYSGVKQEEQLVFNELENKH